MKNLLLVMAALGLLMIPASARFSKFMILSGDSYKGDHAKYQPTLKVNKKNPGFIDVSIPYIDDRRSYWLVVATESLATDKLEFRSIVWRGALPDHVQSIARLAESVHLGESPPKRRGFIDFTIRKELINRVYVYNDYDSPVLDGGVYYSYDLSKHKVDKPRRDNPYQPLCLDDLSYCNL